MSKLNKKVASLIEGSMPCGACEQCLEKAIERFFEGESEAERRSYIEPMADVARLVAATKGVPETVIFVAQKLILKGCSFDNAFSAAGALLDLNVMLRVIHGVEEEAA